MRKLAAPANWRHPMWRTGWNSCTTTVPVPYLALHLRSQRNPEDSVCCALLNGPRAVADEDLVMFKKKLDWLETGYKDTEELVSKEQYHRRMKMPAPNATV